MIAMTLSSNRRRDEDTSSDLKIMDTVMFLVLVFVFYILFTKLFGGK